MDFLYLPVLDDLSTLPAASTEMSGLLRRFALPAAVVCLGAALLTRALFSPSTIATAASAGAAPGGAAQHLSLMGGRIFPCDGRPLVDCQAAALAASIAEAATLRASAGRLECKTNEFSKTGAFCAVKGGSGHGTGNAFLDKGIVAAVCAAAGRGASILDLGAGVGHYEAPYRACGLSWRGFDGSANIEEATDGRVAWADLSVPIDVGPADWVQSLEVGEHLPAQFTDIFVDNLCRHARKGIVLSWAVPGQGGRHHVNNRDNAFVVTALAKRGFALDSARTRTMRSSATLSWMKRTSMIFTRTTGAVSGE